MVPFSRLVEPSQQYANYRIRNINETRVQEFMQKLSITNLKLSSTLTVLVSTSDCLSKEEFNKESLENYSFIILDGNHRYNAMISLKEKGSTSVTNSKVECRVFVGLSEQEAILTAYGENNEKADVLLMTDYEKVSVIRKISQTADKERTEEVVYKMLNANLVSLYLFMAT